MDLENIFKFRVKVIGIWFLRIKNFYFLDVDVIKSCLKGVVG